MAKTLPTISTPEQMVQYLQSWRSSLRGLLNKSATPKIPWNFKATGNRNGITLSWAAVKGADGYELQRADDAGFTINVVSISVPNGLQTQYFDSVGGAVKKQCYQIRATASGGSLAQAVKGLYSGSVCATSIDATDTVTTPSSTTDTSTNDAYQARTRDWKFNE